MFSLAYLKSVYAASAQPRYLVSVETLFCVCVHESLGMRLADYLQLVLFVNSRSINFYTFLLGGG